MMEILLKGQATHFLILYRQLISGCTASKNAKIVFVLIQSKSETVIFVLQPALGMLVRVIAEGHLSNKADLEDFMKLLEWLPMVLGVDQRIKDKSCLECMQGSAQ